MCLVIIENLNTGNNLEIFVSSEDFKNCLDTIDDLKSYKENMLFNVYIYSTNFDKINNNELFSKSIIKKLCSYISKLEEINDFKINTIKIVICKNFIHINYDINDNFFDYNEIVDKK